MTLCPELACAPPEPASGQTARDESPSAAGYVDRSKVAAVGGSHGGLLTGHLVGQHATRFAAGVLRNPVMDISLMVHVSDIPDWCYCEAWGALVRLLNTSTLPEP